MATVALASSVSIFFDPVDWLYTEIEQQPTKQTETDSLFQ